MRLGGPLFDKSDSPESWIKSIEKSGYRAAFCPLDHDAGEDAIKEYAAAAKKADVVIAETGAWSNPLSPVEKERKNAMEKCKKSLFLADRVGARCCVNISGSRGEKWDGPDSRDLTAETFEMIVDVVREIIDEIRPVCTFYTLETMPWMYPDSAENYLRLIKAIDRKSFAVHFDPVNILNSPSRYFENGTVIMDFIKKLGGYIRSCHAKDILLGKSLTVHLDEVRPGKGELDYGVYIREIDRMDADMPLMLEHLASEEEFRLAAGHIRCIADKQGILL